MHLHVHHDCRPLGLLPGILSLVFATAVVAFCVFKTFQVLTKRSGLQPAKGNKYGDKQSTVNNAKAGASDGSGGSQLACMLDWTCSRGNAEQVNFTFGA